MDNEYFKDEIKRAIRVLGKEAGKIQNVTDIWSWYTCGYITKEERGELIEYNKKF